MKIAIASVCCYGLLQVAAFAEPPPAPPHDPASINQTVSPGDTTYRVDPSRGEDMSKLSAIKLSAGDKVVIGPGVHHEALSLTAEGTKEKPVVIEFATGRHEFRADRATKLCYFVSNSADAPLSPRPIGILVKNCRHVRITGGKDTEIWFGDRMTYFINDHSEGITYSRLTFDAVRPTVSEFRVLEIGPNHDVIQVAENSTFKIEKGRFSWTGDLGAGAVMAQAATPATGHCGRIGLNWDPFGHATATDLGGGKVRLDYKVGHIGVVGQQLQMRNTFRDNTSVVNTRCKDIAFRDCNFYSLPGMGIVSQFTENVSYERVNVVPRPGTLRTCPAWADCFHFSGCRGTVAVRSCNFSGMQDDAINVHGTHLRIVEKTAPNQVLVRFMQPQTYGIAAFQPGDKVEFVSHQTLRGYATNTVSEITRKTDKDWLLTLKEPVAAFNKDDAVDNVSWYPDVVIQDCTVTMDSCRGFLLTTRGKALVEGCTFTRTAMSAILVEDDAEGWFESGPIRDLTICNNRFIQCGNPVVWINPHNNNSDPALSVHENIRIEGNFFDGGGISTKSVKGLKVTGNRFSAATLPLQTAGCTEVLSADNRLNVRE